MREPSNPCRTAAVLLMMVVAAPPLAADALPTPASNDHHAVPASPFPTPITPGFLYTPDLARAQSGCAPASHSSRLLDWWRQTWGTGIAHQRAARSDDLEQERPAAFYYLRSPLLSGFYGRSVEAPECAGGGGTAGFAAEAGCALVTLRLGERDHLKRFEVVLPQLEARSARQLETSINARIEKGETVVLLRADGQTYRIVPGLIRGLATRACAGD